MLLRTPAVSPVQMQHAVGLGAHEEVLLDYVETPPVLPHLARAYLTLPTLILDVAS